MNEQEQNTSVNFATVRPIDTDYISNQYDVSLDKAIKREDKIRKETQEREDTAYQRAVQDMQKAGINPNLVGVTPATSGGGITQAKTNETIMSTIANILTEEQSKELQIKLDELNREMEEEKIKLQESALGLDEEKFEFDKNIRTWQVVATFVNGITDALIPG